MRAVLLVAMREFRQIVSTRGFWVMLLIVPVAIGVSVLVSSALAPNPRVAFTLVDASGRYAPQLEQRLENTPEAEIRVAAAEQARITRIRLEKLIDPPPALNEP